MKEERKIIWKNLRGWRDLAYTCFLKTNIACDHVSYRSTNLIEDKKPIFGKTYVEQNKTSRNLSPSYVP